MRKNLFIAIVLLNFVLVPSLYADVYSYNKDSMVIGLIKTYTTKPNESLIEIARKFDLGYNAIVEANPALDPFLPGPGVSVKIPSSWILPDLDSYDGIVINISEMRLYYFAKMKRESLVRTFPIGIGREGWDTPEGTFKIIEKIVNPSWHVPKSIRLEKPELPEIVPPGPDNPLGSHALRLSLGDVLLHGTDKPWAVGRKASHGCIRLYPEDIPVLFQLAPRGLKVTIIRQPVKVGVKNNKVFIEVHREEGVNRNYLNEAIQLLQKKNLLKMVDTEKLYHAIREKRGVPVEISIGTHDATDLMVKK